MRIIENICLLPPSFFDLMGVFEILNICIRKAFTATLNLAERICGDAKLMLSTEMESCQDYVLDTVIYEGGAWTLYSRQNLTLNTLHLHFIGRLLRIT